MDDEKGEKLSLLSLNDQFRADACCVSGKGLVMELSF